MERAALVPRPSDACPDHREVILAIEPAVADNLELLMPIDRAWQPCDYLPDLEADDWREQVERFRQTAQAISDELLVGEHALDEVLAQARIVQPSLFFDGQQGKAGHQSFGE